VDHDLAVKDSTGDGLPAAALGEAMSKAARQRQLTP